MESRRVTGWPLSLCEFCQPRGHKDTMHVCVRWASTSAHDRALPRNRTADRAATCLYPTMGCQGASCLRKACGCGAGTVCGSLWLARCCREAQCHRGSGVAVLLPFLW